MNRPDDEVPRFGALADYERPSGPVTHVALRLWQRARRIVRRDDERVVRNDRLEQASRATIGDFTASPDCSQLARELDATLGDWAGARDTSVAADTLRLIVIPPGDRVALLATWAERHGHAVLEPPSFDSLVGAAGGARRTPDPPDLEGSGVLVIPRLERWFVRHRHGLDLVRALLAELSRTERRCVVGCNSWAWAFLCRAAGADLVLPEPLVFAPFDAARLATWFGELAEAEQTSNVVFREVGSGGDVLARDTSGELESDFLAGLAARSRGVPWVAWQLWQRSLRTERVEKKGESEERDTDEDLDEVSEEENTLWLVEADELALPLGHERGASLVLHALLLHGTLDVEGLALVLPLVGESNLMPALVRAGFVERVEDGFRCTEGAYPAIVERLATEGVSMPVV